jgi:hypothetical protein
MYNSPLGEWYGNATPEHILKRLNSCVNTIVIISQLALQVAYPRHSGHLNSFARVEGSECIDCQT